MPSNQRRSYGLASAGDGTLILHYSGEAAGILFRSGCRWSVRGTDNIRPVLLMFNPSRTPQTDPALTQCTSPLIANSDARGNAPSFAYRVRRSRACNPSNASAYADALGRVASRLRLFAGSSVRTKRWYAHGGQGQSVRLRGAQTSSPRKFSGLKRLASQLRAASKL